MLPERIYLVYRSLNNIAYPINVAAHAYVSYRFQKKKKERFTGRKIRETRRKGKERERTVAESEKKEAE